MLKKLWIKHWVRWCIFYFTFLFLVFLCRKPILTSIASYLIQEDEPVKVNLAFVLSGNSIDRGTEATKLYKQGFIKKLVCPGGNMHPLFEAMGFKFLESEVTKMAMVKMGVPDSVIEILPKGKSTNDEAKLLIDYCKKHNTDTVMIVSSEFHTRRIKYALKGRFAKGNLTVIVIGAPDHNVRAWNWWWTEDGLIMINNEWIKLLYYYWIY